MSFDRPEAIGLAPEFPEFSTESEYRRYLSTVAELPAGFRVSTASIAFIPSERPTLEPYRMNLSLICADEPTESFGGVFTRNAFPGAPVILGRRRMDEPSIQGVVINNKIANVRSTTGIRDAERITEVLGRELHAAPEKLLSVSTGIIGWKLPIPEMEGAIPELVSGLHAGSALDVADAIMTTDSFPKVRRVALGEGSVVGIAKGAGMIEPNMATMLVFLLTDVAIDREAARSLLRTSVDGSFNTISVDGDMSTSDMVLLLSSGVKPAVSEAMLGDAIGELSSRLAADIVRNGEGTGHVIHVQVSGLPDNATARAAAKAIVNSPLVKTAMYGNDPNVGRILSALGDYAGNAGLAIEPEKVRIDVGPETVYAAGAFEIDREKEIRLSEYLKSAALNPRLLGYPQHQRSVEIRIACDGGAGVGEAIGADLSDQYVRENADYRT
ncbi:MAG: bifunctional ornithine acetyltransferase/N-acetylglutamate synthase [Spirochaetales bacterium]|nr:bifunctional ornithine acetyltransferase/N-acetylglutamate synthase [Spirochaetales bacterium]